MFFCIEVGGAVGGVGDAEGVAVGGALGLRGWGVLARPDAKFGGPVDHAVVVPRAEACGLMRWQPFLRDGRAIR